jgi:hypothetical protein
MCMSYQRTKLNMPINSTLLVVVVKRKDKYTANSAVTPYCFTFYKNIISTKLEYFSNTLFTPNFRRLRCLQLKRLQSHTVRIIGRNKQTSKQNTYKS